MSVAVLKYMDDLMQSMGIPYEFMRWQHEPPDACYFTGEYTELEMSNREENGRQDITFILRGFTRGSWLLLEEAKEKIEKHVAKTAILPDGTGIAVFYGSAMPVPTGDAELKSIKINLNIQEWKVN